MQPANLTTDPVFNVNLTVLSYHKFVEQTDEYRFSRTYEQFGHDISKKKYDWITIDDGMNCMIQACDMLRHCNIRAKLFICTSLIGQPGYCTWEEIKELSKYHDIENHSHIHEWHTKMWPHHITSHLTKASELILNATGRLPRYFVPPYNQFDDTVEHICKDLNLILVKNRITILNITK